MSDRIKQSYKQSKNIYDDALTQEKWWSKLYIKLFWGGVDDKEIARKLLEYIPKDFHGSMLDVPVGTAVFTWQKYQNMKNADIICLDYSEDMLEQAQARFAKAELSGIKTMQGDVGNLPFADETFDIVLSMNGFHAFPDKDKAFLETNRVLKQGGLFISTFYIKGKSKITDWLIHKVFAKKGWFTPPFETEHSLRKRLEKMYTIKEFHVEGSMVFFLAEKDR